MRLNFLPHSAENAAKVSAIFPAKGTRRLFLEAGPRVWAWLWLWLSEGGRCWEQPRLPPTPAGAEVLMATLGGTRSHTAPFLALGRQLARRGHRVTLLSAFPPPPGEETPGVRQLNPEPLVRYVSELTRGWDLLGARARGDQPVPPWEAVRFGLQVRRRVQQRGGPRTAGAGGSGRGAVPGGRGLVRGPALALLDGAFPDCLLALAHRLGAPHALLNTVAAHPGAASWAAASPAPFSVTPFMGLPYTDRMALPQRLLNAAYHVALRAMQVLSTKLLLEPCVRRHLGPDVPPISWLARNTSFVLQNALSPTTLPRAYFPDVAEVGCLHCRPAKPLPQDLEEFVSGSPSGFVLVSMGSGVRAANMPAELHRLLMTAFGSLPYRVLWKHEAGPGSEGVVPGNVMLRRWLPQQDLLGHPRLRAFVGHGGLLSVLEAGFHGAPLLALPVFCDHDANAAAARRAGFARVLQLQGLTAPALAAAVRAVATDPRYREAAYRQSVLIRDQPTPPLEKAVFWTEYLLRHKADTRHLQSAARDMAWWQLYCLDLALVVLGLPVLLWVALSRLCHLLLHSRRALAKKLKAH
ncbi:UDP-glucuronosyltransferase 2C1-like [Schistocerca piceifrons]|uniref:UDP-glucuronosyltransferase 2C1-like n=1 Tax=Schistocerca piceifrons TaxID=274613 RepID=UPI001F5EE076|nr:UDP-glucuronosyltransferase 2C1-like [Schistocerca piceifrons]